MDTSPEYILQCEKAEEIQALWQCKSGDWFYAKENLGDANDKSFIAKGEIVCNGDIANFCWESSCDFGGGIDNFNNAIWLPRQDQLQAILDIKHHPTLLLHAFHKWAVIENNWVQYLPYGDGEATNCPFTSMEQLWLAFVMKEKYDKVWTGEDWETL